MEIKTKVIQLLLVNSFTEMDHEDPINHLTKLCKNAESLGASNSKDENLYLRLFPHSLIGRAKDWYFHNSDKLEHFGGQVHQTILSS